MFGVFLDQAGKIEVFVPYFSQVVLRYVECTYTWCRNGLIYIDLETLFLVFLSPPEKYLGKNKNKNKNKNKTKTKTKQKQKQNKSKTNKETNKNDIHIVY